MTTHITRNEWRWVALMGLLVLLAASLPTLAGWASSTPEHQFTGIIAWQDDGYSYLVKTRLGAYGEWLYHNVYTVEEQPGILLFLPYIVLGRLAGPSPYAILFTFHLSRVVYGAVYLALLYPFVALLLTEVWQRRLAWLLISMGGGLGLLLVPISGQPLPFGNAPLSLYLNEAFSIVMLMGTPHIALARSALIVGLLLYLRAAEHNDWRYASAAGGAWLASSGAVISSNSWGEDGLGQ